MASPAADPRRTLAERFGRIYEHGLRETATELLDVFMKRLPWKWLVVLVLAASTTMLKFVVVPRLASLAVQDWAERRGVDLRVSGWHAELWDLRVRATGLSIHGTDRFSRENLLEAGSVELDFGATYHLFQFLYLRPLLDLVRLDLSAYQLSKVVLDHAVLNIERRMSGHGNWDTTLTRLDLGRPAPADGVIPAAVSVSEGASGWPSFTPRTIEVKQLKVEWIENLPGGSGGGLIRNVQETLFIDDVDVVARNRYADAGLEAAQFNLEGRTADGRVSMSGTWAPRTQPTLATKTVLDNVGANAFARMVPDPALVPVSGAMTGSIELTLAADGWSCAGDLQLQNVAYQPVYDSYLARQNSEALSAGLRDFRANRRVQLDCEGLKEDAGFGLVPYLQTRATAKAVEDAPKAVRALAEVEVHRTQAGVAGEDDLKTFVSRAVAGKMGNELAGALAAAAVDGALGGQGIPVPARALPSAGGRAPAPSPAPAAPGGVRGFGQRLKSFFSR